MGSLQFETDRASFWAAAGTSGEIALHQPLSTPGPGPDPASACAGNRLGPGETGTVTFITAQGTRKEMEEVAEKSGSRDHPPPLTSLRRSGWNTAS